MIFNRIISIPIKKLRVSTSAAVVANQLQSAFEIRRLVIVLINSHSFIIIIPIIFTHKTVTTKAVIMHRLHRILPIEIRVHTVPSSRVESRARWKSRVLISVGRRRGRAKWEVRNRANWTDVVCRWRWPEMPWMMMMIHDFDSQGEGVFFRNF